MRIGSIFSGIGGIELGLERAGLGRTVFHAETDPYCSSVLERHWPGVPNVGDVRNVPVYAPECDLICGGFPCQDLSSLHTYGQRKGLQGPKSSLWSVFAFVVSVTQPRLVVVENVSSGWKQWLPQVRRDLHTLGYGVCDLEIAAAGLGAPHQRRRIFVVGDSHGNSESALAFYEEVARLSADAGSLWDWGPSPPGGFRVDDGVPKGMDRLRVLGNSVVPQCAEFVGRCILRAIGEIR